MTHDWQAVYQQHAKDLQTALTSLDEFHRNIAAAVTALQHAFATGHKVLVAGNGGSSTLAQHLSDEMVGRYRSNRRAYPVIALTADSAVITCIGNDYGYEAIFSRQIEALGQAGDVFIGFSTSGKSPNIIAAAQQAKQQGVTVISFTGNQGTLKDLADIAIISPAITTNRIQELDLHAVHLLCEPFEPEYQS